MSLYIHIPFCHSKCAYCGFYSVVGQSMRNDWLKAICKEICSRGSELEPNTIHSTIYFGGGTPSILNRDEWQTIIDCINKNHKIAPFAEWTLEANPEDITIENATFWKSIGFNRISIGIQSLNENALKASLRKHSAEEACIAIKNAHEGGFNNIGVDFIIGLPESGRSDIQLASKLLDEYPITHVSLYILSIDEGSILFKKKQKGEFHTLSDDQEAELYKEYCKMITSKGFEHYEISNFAKPGYKSQHNSTYWEQKPYLGFGPAAHSYNGTDCRRWNIANIKKYNQAWLENGSISSSAYEYEILTDIDCYNELIMTRLRTSNGIPIELLNSVRFQQYWELNKGNLNKYIESGYVKIEMGIYN